MDGQTIVTIVSTVVALLGGAFGVKLLDKWFDRDRLRTETLDHSHQREFADNEQARKWLQEQLRDRDAELDELRKSERTLLERVGILAEQVARQEERSVAQARQIELLQASVEKWGSDYADMKSERDAYRTQKHDADNKLTPVLLRATIAERDLIVKEQEIERLREQLITAATKEAPG